MNTIGISNSIYKFLRIALILTSAFLNMNCTVTNSNQDVYVPTEHDITQADADLLTNRYRQMYPTTSIGDIFTKTAVESVIKQNKISGIRYYYGMEASQPVLIIVGTTLNTTTNTHDDIEQGVILASPNSRTINISQAAGFTKTYRLNNSGGIYGGFFKIEAVKAVLYDYNDPDTCTGMRFYYGLDSTNKRQLILRGTTSTATSRGSSDIPGGRIIDMSIPCPRECGNRNQLNGM